MRSTLLSNLAGFPLLLLAFSSAPRAAEDQGEQLRRVIQAQEKQLKEAQKSLQQLNDLLTAERTRRGELENQLRATQARTEQLEKVVQDLTRELAARRAEGGKVTVRPNPGPRGKGPLVEGTIAKVDQAFVSISIGADAGLEQGQRLDVFRLDPKPLYLGNIEIVTVAPRQAVGKVIGKPTSPLKVGDRVTTQLKDK